MTIPPKANASLTGEADAKTADMGGLQGERSTGGSSLCEVAYSRGLGQYDAAPAQRTATSFAAFRDAILADRATAKGQQWIAGAFAVAPDDPEHRQRFAESIGQHHRCSACARPRRWMGLDVDGHGSDFTPEAFATLVLHLQRYSGLIYTTASHTDEAPRCRIVLELDLPAPRAELKNATQAIRARIDAAMVAEGHARLPWDASCDRPEQPLYLPLSGAWSRHLDGTPLALGDLLADVAAKAAQDAPQAPRVDSAAEPTAWALGALERACRAVAAAPEGARNEVLNREAYGMGGLAASGQLSQSLANAALFDATRRAGYATPDSDRRKIADGIAAGMAKPRTDGLPPVAANDGQLIAVDLTDVMTSEARPPRFIVDPIIPRNVATLLGGHGGLGKSMLGLTLCAHVASGRGWGPFTIEQGRAVFVSLEDPGDLVRDRLRCVIEEYQLPAAEVLRNLLVFDGADVDAALVAESRAAGVVELIERPMLREVPVIQYRTQQRMAPLTAADTALDTELRAFLRTTDGATRDRVLQSDERALRAAAYAPGELSGLTPAMHAHARETWLKARFPSDLQAEKDTLLCMGLLGKARAALVTHVTDFIDLDAANIGDDNQA